MSAHNRIDCKRRIYKSSRDRSERECDYAYARRHALLGSRTGHERHKYDPSVHIKRADPKRKTEDPHVLLRLRSERLRHEFAVLAERWRCETGFLSSFDEKILHEAYQSIIAMGMDAVPLVLEELDARRGHWFWALHFMTKGVDPVPEGANVDAAREAWLRWGRQKGYLR